MGLIEISEGRPATTSRAVAEKFGKTHNNVLVDIRKLIKQWPDQDTVLHFQQRDFTTEKGNTYSEYLLSKKAFCMLAMRFTGDKAFQWQFKFIDAFELMESRLAKTTNDIEWKAARLQSKSIRKATADVIQDFVAYATAQGSKNASMYYANITKMEYKALDMLEQSKSTSGNFRDTLDILQIGYLQVAESIASKAIEKGMQDDLHYKEIYIFAKQKVTEYAQSISWARLA